MAPPPTRRLFPSLPAELRHEIYTHTITPSNPATHIGLPFKSKIYDSSHTKVEIYPVHHGNPSLLALGKYHFLEAHEYHTHLLSKATSLLISITFKGHLHTFIQKHWDAKMNQHLRRLTQKFRCIAQAAHWDIKIFWDPHISSSNLAPEGAMPRIVNAMLDTLLSFCEPGGKTADVVLNVGLYLDPRSTLSRYLWRGPCGLEAFLGHRTVSARAKMRTERREVRVAIEQAKPVAPTGSLIERRDILNEDAQDKIVVDSRGIVQWGSATEGGLVMRSVVEGDRAWREIESRELDMDKMAQHALLAECEGIADAVVVRKLDPRDVR